MEADGTINAGDTEIARLGVWDFSPVSLVRAGESFFQSTDPATPIDTTVRQGFLEASNTNLVEELTTLLAVQRTYQANQTILSQMDETLNEATQLGTL